MRPNPHRRVLVAGLACALVSLTWWVAPGASAHGRGGMGPRPAPRPPMKGPNVMPNVPNVGKVPVPDHGSRALPPGHGSGPQRPAEADVRVALGFPPTGPLSPEQQAVIDDIFDTWDAIASGEMPEFDSDNATIQAVDDIPVLGPVPQHVIDRENMIAAVRRRQREEDEWRVWIITKTGGLIVAMAGGGLPGAVIYNEVTSSSSDPNTAGERAEAKVKGDLSGDALGTGAGYVAGRVADRLVPGSGGMVGGAVRESVSQVMGDQVENALKDKYRRQREAAAAFADEHGEQVGRDTFGGPLPTVPPEVAAANVDPRTMRPTAPGSGGGSTERSIPVLRNADRSGGASERSIPVLRNADRSGGGDSVPVLRASRDSVPVLRAASSDGEAGRNAGATQTQWWAR